MFWRFLVQELVKLLFSQNENLLAALGLILSFAPFQRNRTGHLVAAKDFGSGSFFYIDFKFSDLPLPAARGTIRQHQMCR